MVWQCGVDNEQLTQEGYGQIPARDQRTGCAGRNGEGFGGERLSDSVRTGSAWNDHERAVVESQLNHVVRPPRMADCFKVRSDGTGGAARASCCSCFPISLDRARSGHSHIPGIALSLPALHRSHRFLAWEPRSALPGSDFGGLALALGPVPRRPSILSSAGIHGVPVL